MKSVIYELTSPGVLTHKELELDENNLRENEIVAKTEYSAISTGTEIAAWLGKPPLRPSVMYPRLMGYCNLAQVMKIGSAVTNVKPGDYVLTHQSHRSAFICPQSDILLHTTSCDEILRKKLTAIYLYHLGYSALLAGGYKPGHQVAIIGMGTLGITTASLAKAFGTKPIIFTNQEINKEQMDQIGLTHIFNKHDAHAFKHLLFDIDGVDIVINTSNNWADFLLSMQVTRKKGEVICLGFPGRGEPKPDFNPLDSQYFYDKQLSIKQCGYTTDLDISPVDVRFTLKRNLNYLSQLVIDKTLDPSCILSKEISWRQLETIYQSLSTRKNNLYSALINWKYS
jgi:2-desacetyl-2-hydroxyethyl bacteriochlorophyllide A dehydrogenase